MKSQVTMTGRVFGGYELPQYDVRVSTGPVLSDVTVTFTYHYQNRDLQENGQFVVPVSVARRLGYALLAASCGPGPLEDDGVVFNVDEKENSQGTDDLETLRRKAAKSGRAPLQE